MEKQITFINARLIDPKVEIETIRDFNNKWWINRQEK